MIGMAIAIVTTLLLMGVGSPATWGLIILAIAIGGGIGAFTAKRIPMTAMPQLVAAFHSLVGLAAVFVAARRSMRRSAFGIGDAAVTSQQLAWSRCRSASPSARSPLPARSSPSPSSHGRMSGAPIMLPMRHVINIGLFAAIVIADYLAHGVSVDDRVLADRRSGRWCSAS